MLFRSLADVIRPKFELVDKYLNSLPKGLASWTKPTGGYFISFDSKPGQASIGRQGGVGHNVASDRIPRCL